MMSLDEKDYLKYLKEAYYIKTGYKLNLKHPKTFNEKIQWLKIYDNLPVKTKLTDKVLVRDWIKDKIGEEYLKPVLWIGDKFDDIPFDELPESFIVKCNHGCKWHFIVKNKQQYLKNKLFISLTKIQIDGWISQSFFGWSIFETQYKNIVPKIIIEPLLRENINEDCEEIDVYCFNSEPEIINWHYYDIEARNRKAVTFNKNFNSLDLKFLNEDVISEKPINEYIKKTVELSRILAKNFKFVRVDWMIYKDKLYFEEMTFTPYSGFIMFPQNYEKWNKKLGDMLNLKGVKNG